ncbi:MAG: site-2 protease family protein [Spirochaetota bacterium]
MLFGLGTTDLLLFIPAILLGFTLHEYAHARLAVALGDPTPRERGRLTLNPLRHIDLVGLLLILTVGFGWARPVQFDPSRFKRPRRGRAAVAVIGPAANLVLAVVLVLVLRFVVSPGDGASGRALVERGLVLGIYLNLVLLVLNMLPLPPLDGSHLVLVLIPDDKPRLAQLYVRYGAVVLLVLILGGTVFGRNILPIGNVATSLLQLLFRLAGL